MKTLWFSFVAAGCALINHTDAFAQDKVRVGLSSVSALHGAMWVAEQKGLFRKHGIETEIIVTGQGATAGAVMTIPFVFIAEDRGFRVLVDLAETDIYYLHTMIASTRSYIKANRDNVLRFLKGFLEGIAYFKHNKKESLEIVRKKLRVNAEQERNLERSYDLLATKYYETTPYPSLRGVETVLGLLEKDSPKAKSADPKSFVDDSLLREIDQSGFIKKLYER